MSKNKVKVIYLDGDVVEETWGARAEVEVERRFGMPFTEAFKSGEHTPFERLYFLAWATLRYRGKTDVEFDDWLNLVEDCDVVDVSDDGVAPEDDLKDPTQRAARPAKSSKSASRQASRSTS